MTEVRSGTGTYPAPRGTPHEPRPLLRKRAAGSHASRAVTLSLCLCCAITGGAATPAAARVSDRDVARSLKIAYEYWASMTDRVRRAGYNCQRGRVRGRWVRDLGSAMATAEIGGCANETPKVKLEEPTIRHLSDAHTCAVLSHEFGHLLGYTHNRREGSIMHASSGTRSGLRVPRRATWDRVYRDAYCGRF